MRCPACGKNLAVAVVVCCGQLLGGGHAPGVPAVSAEMVDAVAAVTGLKDLTETPELHAGVSSHRPSAEPEKPYPDMPSNIGQLAGRAVSMSFACGDLRGYRCISVASQAAGCSESTLRRLHAGGIVHPARSASGWRMFTEDDIAAARRFLSHREAAATRDSAVSV
jgi:MerR HTH family regulatory protein